MDWAFYAVDVYVFLACPVLISTNVLILRSFIPFHDFSLGRIGLLSCTFYNDCFYSLLSKDY